MGGLPDNRKPLPDGRLVRYGHDIRRNPLSDGNSHSARAEKAAETFHRQFGKAELGDTGDLRCCSSAPWTGNGEKPCSVRLRLRNQDA